MSSLHRDHITPTENLKVTNYIFNIIYKPRIDDHFEKFLKADLDKLDKDMVSIHTYDFEDGYAGVEPVTLKFRVVSENPALFASPEFKKIERVYGCIVDTK